MDAGGNPLLLQMKQLFVLYLYGLQGSLRIDNMLAHFKDFPEEAIPNLETLLNEKSRLYLMNGVQRFEEYLEREEVPGVLEKLHKWHLRTKFVCTYMPEAMESKEVMAQILEYLFLQEPSLPLVQEQTAAFKESAQRDLQVLQESNAALEAIRQESNERIYELMHDLFPDHS